MVVFWRVHGVKDRCATIIPRDSGGRFLLSARRFGEVFFKKIPRQRAKSNPARAGLQLAVAQMVHDSLVNQAAKQRHVGAVGREAGDFAALAKRQTP